MAISLTLMLRTSTTTQPAKNLSLLTLVEDTEVGCNKDWKDETVKRLLSNNLNKAKGYLTPNIKQVLIKLKQVFIKVPIF